MKTGEGGRTIFLLCQLSSVTHTNLLTSLDRLVRTDFIRGHGSCVPWSTVLRDIYRDERGGKKKQNKKQCHLTFTFMRLIAGA